MGFLRILFWSIFGPFLVLLGLWGHVIYQIGFVDPPPIKVPGWVEGADEAMKSTLIANRKYILNDFMDLMASYEQSKAKRFIENRLTDDFVWEDPFEKYEGKEEFADLMYLSKYVQNIEFKIHSEHHSTHEMLMDWTLKVYLTFMPNYPFNLSMRTHFLLEPAEAAGSGEKVFKIFEEWNGNVHLNERNTVPKVLGTIHQKLRRFVGQGASWIVRKGLV